MSRTVRLLLPALLASAVLLTAGDAFG